MTNQPYDFIETSDDARPSRDRNHRGRTPSNPKQEDVEDSPPRPLFEDYSESDTVEVSREDLNTVINYTSRFLAVCHEEDVHEASKSLAGELLEDD